MVSRRQKGPWLLRGRIRAIYRSPCLVDFTVEETRVTVTTTHIPAESLREGDSVVVAVRRVSWEPGAEVLALQFLPGGSLYRTGPRVPGWMRGATAMILVYGVTHSMMALAMAAALPVIGFDLACAWRHGQAVKLIRAMPQGGTSL